MEDLTIIIKHIQEIMGGELKFTSQPVCSLYIISKKQWALEIRNGYAKLPNRVVDDNIPRIWIWTKNMGYPDTCLCIYEPNSIETAISMLTKYEQEIGN